MREHSVEQREQSRLYRTEAVVLRHQDFGEADRIITVYTPARGKLRLLAKGVRKTMSRLGGHVEKFVRARLLVAVGRNLDIVTQAETIEAYHHLRDDPHRATLAYYCAELMNRVVEEGEHPGNAGIWQLLLQTLDRLDSARSPDMARLFFMQQLISQLGYRPQLQTCLSCDEALQPTANFISARGGGVLCPGCGRHDPASRPLSVNVLKVLRAIDRGDWPALDRLRLDEELRRDVTATLDAFVHHLVERDLKSEALLNTMRNLDQPAPAAPRP